MAFLLVCLVGKWKKQKVKRTKVDNKESEKKDRLVPCSTVVSLLILACLFLFGTPLLHQQWNKEHQKTRKKEEWCFWGFQTIVGGRSLVNKMLEGCKRLLFSWVARIWTCWKRRLGLKEGKRFVGWEEEKKGGLEDGEWLVEKKSEREREKTMKYGNGWLWRCRISGRQHLIVVWPWNTTTPDVVLLI